MPVSCLLRQIGGTRGGLVNVVGLCRVGVGGSAVVRGGRRRCGVGAAYLAAYIAHVGVITAVAHQYRVGFLLAVAGIDGDDCTALLEFVVIEIGFAFWQAHAPQIIGNAAAASFDGIANLVRAETGMLKIGDSLLRLRVVFEDAHYQRAVSCLHQNPPFRASHEKLLPLVVFQAITPLHGIRMEKVALLFSFYERFLE